MEQKTILTKEVILESLAAEFDQEQNSSDLNCASHHFIMDILLKCDYLRGLEILKSIKICPNSIPFILRAYAEFHTGIQREEKAQKERLNKEYKDYLRKFVDEVRDDFGDKVLAISSRL